MRVYYGYIVKGTIWNLILKCFFIGLCRAHIQDEEVKGIEETPVRPVTVLVGTKALLPCPVASHTPEDKPVLVLFYQGTLAKPIYSLDARDGPLSLGVKWVATDVFGSRVRFDLRSSTSGLVIEPVLAEDSGLYWCRVDFQASPTRNERIRLDVVVPPNRIFISNDAGLEVSGLIGPYGLGHSVALTCNVEGGTPLPRISWYKKNNRGILVSEVLGSTLGGRSDTMLIRDLTREDLFAVITCNVTNSRLAPPMSTSVTLDITFPPLEVSLFGIDRPLREKEATTAVCEAVGSRPAANITWWRDGIRDTNATVEVFEKGNITRSILAFTPNISDHLANLVCRARNPVMPLAVIEASAKFNILYSPRLSLSAGRGLNMDDIKEGEDVYFECDINANPEVQQPKWFHNGEELTHKPQDGLLLGGNNALVLQKLRKSWAGDYFCAAHNTQGSGQSNVIKLNIKYVPLCELTRHKTFGVDQNETIRVTCNARSHPPPLKYSWAFNTSSELLDLSWIEGQTEKELTYSPRSDLDYGSLLCWAQNEIGKQEHPCVYHVIKTALPNPVHDCIAHNVSASSAFIICHPGWNGGAQQFFSLRIQNDSNPQENTLKPNQFDPILLPQGKLGSGGAPRPLAKAVPAPKPFFHLTGLHPNTLYVLNVYATNRRGSSPPTRVLISTAADVAERRVGPDNGSSTLPGKDHFGYLPLAVFSSSLAFLLLVFLIVAVVVRVKHSHNHRSRREGDATLHFALQKHPEEVEGIEGDAIEAQKDEKTPDVIPSDKSSPKSFEAPDPAEKTYHTDLFQSLEPIEIEDLREATFRFSSSGVPHKSEDLLTPEDHEMMAIPTHSSYKSSDGRDETSCGTIYYPQAERDSSAYKLPPERKYYPSDIPLSMKGNSERCTNPPKHLKSSVDEPNSKYACGVGEIQSQRTIEDSPITPPSLPNKSSSIFLSNLETFLSGSQPESSV